MATGEKQMQSMALATDLTGARVIGVDRNGKDASFSISMIKGDFKGDAISTTDPGIPALAQYYNAQPGVTYVNFKDATNVAITVPWVSAGKAVVGAQLSWSGTYWTCVPLLLDQSNIGSFDKVGTLEVITSTGTITINFNRTTMQLETTISATGASLLVTQGPRYFGVITANTDIVTTQLTTLKALGMNFIVYKKSDQKLYVYNYTKMSDAQTNDFIWLGTCVDMTIGNLKMLGGDSIITVNNAGKPGTETMYNRMAAILTQDLVLSRVNIDTSAKTITTTKGAAMYVVFGGDFYSPGAGLSEAIQLTGTDYTGLYYLYYQISTTKFRLFHYTLRANAKNNDHLLIGWFYNLTTVAAPSTLMTISKCISFNGTLAIPQSGNASTGELMVNPKLWYINGESLPFYRTSLIRNVAEMGNEIILCDGAEGVGDFGYPKFRTLHNYFDLTATEIKSTLKIRSKNYSVAGSDYGVDVSVSFAAAAAKTGLTKNWLCWGDSLTNRGVAKYTTDYLTSIGSGLTLVNHGTINSLGKKGEGREGWTWLNFIGADNLHLGTGTVLTRLADGATTSTNYENPFLRLATSADYTSHPSWCFRNTGANAELSYATDPDKTGAFYIFDPAYYAANHLTIGAPDLVTIALGTNDITENGAAGVANALLGVEVVLTQLKQAFPNVKIGIIPATIQGDNSTNWANVCDYINQLNTKLTTLALSDVNTVGIWMHQNKHFIFPYTGNTNLKSDGNLTKVYTKSENIHFDVNGYYPYAKALGAYIINVI